MCPHHSVMNIATWKRLEERFQTINQDCLNHAKRFYHASFVTIIAFLLRKEPNNLSHARLVELYTWAEHLAANDFAIGYLSHRVLQSRIEEHKQILDVNPPPQNLQVYHLAKEQITQPPHPNIQRKFDKNDTLVFFDLETTGLSIIEDRIIEFTGIRLNPHTGRFTKFSSRINPQIPIPSDASRIHKIFDIDVQDCPTLPQIIGDIYCLFKDAIIIGFNIHKYDIPLLQNELLRFQFPFNLQHKATIDLAQIFWRNVPDGTSKSLAGAVAYYTENIMQNAHQSSADALVCAHIFEAMIVLHDFPKCSELSAFCMSELNLPRYEGKREDCIVQWNLCRTNPKLNKRPASPTQPPKTPPNKRPRPTSPLPPRPKQRANPPVASTSTSSISSSSQGSTQPAKSHNEGEKDKEDQGNGSKLKREGAVIIN
jgi:DNA polymerase III epsilon subunit-like protein